MPIMSDVKLPAGELDEHHLFRKKKFKHLYFCPKCKRSFDSVEHMEKCKTCSTELIEMEPPSAPEGVKHRYYCPVCEKNFTTDEKATQCINCGNKLIHQYEWSGKEKTDNVRMKVVDIKATFKRLFSKLRRRGSKSSAEPQRIEEVKEAGKDTLLEESNSVRPMFRLNLFSKDPEEMPTK